MKFFSKRVKSSMIGLLYCSNTNASNYTSYTDNTQNFLTNYPVSAPYPLQPLNATQENFTTSNTNASNYTSYRENAQNISTEYLVTEPSPSQPLNDAGAIHATEEKFTTSKWRVDNVTRLPNTTSTNKGSMVEKSGSETTALVPFIPTDSSSWYDIREHHGIYVDKTRFLVQFFSHVNLLIFYTRPRRFGKTMLVDMIARFFGGEERLFRNTFIFPFGNCGNGTWIKYPILHFDFNQYVLQKFKDPAMNPKKMLVMLETNFKEALLAFAKKYKLETSNISDLTLPLLIELLDIEFRLPVVILIDEYDRILNTVVMKLNNKMLIKDIADFYDDIFTQIKSKSRLIKLAWVTGVSRYGLKELASGPNSFEDYTYNSNYAAAAGFTKEEIEQYFGHQIQNFATEFGKQPQDIMDNIQKWYDGYSYDVKNQDGQKIKVYNPVSVLNCLRDQNFKMYWSETGLVAYILGEMYQRSFPLNKCIDYEISDTDLFEKYTPGEKYPIPMLMFIYGYLTIKKTRVNISSFEKEIIHTLNFPNREIKTYINNRYERYIPSRNSFIGKTVEAFGILQSSLEDYANFAAVVKILNELQFPIFSHPLDNKSVEYDVTRRICIILNEVGIRTENPQLMSSSEGNPNEKNKGDLDIVTSGLDINYVFEIKVGNRKLAVEQITEYFKDHYNAFQKALNDQTKIYLTAINFSKDKNSQIKDWVVIPCNGTQMQIDRMVYSSDQMKEIAETQYHKLYNTPKFSYEDVESELSQSRGSTHGRSNRRPTRRRRRS